MNAAGEREHTLLVEDDPSMQQRLKALLQAGTDRVASVQVAGSLAQARDWLARQPPLHTVVLDLGLPDGSGLELLAWLQQHRPEVDCVVVSSWSDESVVLDALRGGAVGYLLKERDDDELRAALASIARGGAPIDPFVARGLLALLPAPPPVVTAVEPAEPVPITPRETEILKWVAQGHSNREIAQELGLSPLTIESYTKSIYRKLAVGSRTAAVFAARQHGWLQ